MFKGRTVFILGAGASKPYEFPTGYELVTDIVKNFTIPEKIGLLHRSMEKFLVERKTDLVGNFEKSLSKAMPNSIDDYLEYHPEYLEVGKAAIALALIPYEKEATLFNRNQSVDWYSMIVEVLRKDIESLQNKKISFVTFNYDRSLDHYLFTQLREFLNLSLDDSNAVMKKIPIVHIYGQIGSLPWQGGQNIREYESKVNESIIQTAMQDLLVIHEANKVQNNFEEAQKLFQLCDRIIFLGYGYHEANNMGLNLIEKGKGKQLFGTAVNLSAFDRQKIRKYFGIHLDTEGRDIVRCFREKIPLE
jgi:hypothetical protein